MFLKFQIHCLALPLACFGYPIKGKCPTNNEIEAGKRRNPSQGEEVDLKQKCLKIVAFLENIRHGNK